MPVLSDPRHERFAQNLAAGMTATAAYAAAGFKANRGNAATLKANQAVAKRVAELQQDVADALKAETFDKVKALTRVAELNLTEGSLATAIAVAAEAGDIRGLVASAVEALKLAEVLSGGVSDRTETKETGALDEVESRLARLTARSGTAGDTSRPH